MAAIDYEAEYNNRVRVPDYEQIFARWAQEGELYRADALKRDRAELELSYGDTPRQTVDLFMPDARESAPIAMFIHGGWWRSLSPSQFSQMSRGPNAHGITVAVVGYDLCPNVGIGDIVEQMRRACIFLWQRFGKRLFIYGHSAGGHLTGAMVATDWATIYPKAPADLVPAGYSVSGLFDLTPLVGITPNQDFHLTPETARALSPALWPLPSGRVFDAVVGGLESSEFLRQSKLIAQNWQGTGATRYEEITGKNHFTVVDAFADPQSAMTARVVELARQVKT
jgi:arylformamidase